MMSNQAHTAWKTRSILALLLIGLALVSGAFANTKTQGSASALRADSAAEVGAKPGDDDNPLEDDEEIPEGECDTAYECEFYYIHRPVGEPEKVYRYLLDGVCNSAEDYKAMDTDSHEYSFNVCGTTHKYCLPPKYNLPYIYGAAIQWLDDKAPDKDCHIPVTNDTKPCTASCEVLGKGRPIFELIQEENPETGFKLKHFGEPDMGEDGFPCPLDPIRGGYVDRQVIYKFICDQSAPKPFASEPVVEENPLCTYTFELRSPYGCPVELEPEDTSSGSQNSDGGGGGSHGGLAAGMFFFGFLLTGAILFAAWKYRQNGGNLKFWQGRTSAPPSSSNAFAPAGSSSYSTVRT
eukprot:gb/GECG01008777.1/.p1 GENE.gb/GECG01008777.1/~~gb/GECG01008777.1/.p1  ORF type:complete len:350 (+),score=37.69 gb/GECG01008777.1/:1-1050(+)